MRFLGAVIAISATTTTIFGPNSATCHAFIHNHKSNPYPLQTTTTSTKIRATLSTTDEMSTGFVGEADRAFRQGIQLEKFGQARAASAAFHEAATLYQCFLDHHRLSTEPSTAGVVQGEEVLENNNNEDAAGSEATANEFGHVTTLHPDGPNAAPSVLAYACVRLAHLNHDALGDSKAATRLYKDAARIDPQPSSVAYDGIGTSIEGSDGDLKKAVQAYREARKLSPSNGQVLFHLAVALERLGETEESEIIMESLRRADASISCFVDSWGYVRWHTRRIPNTENNLHRGTRSMLQIGLEAAKDLISNHNGLICEFGVGSGRSIRMIQEILPLNVPIHGFDTFTGLPQAWGNEPAGTYSTGGIIPNLEGDVFFHKGLFSDTIPPFLERTDKERPLAFANIDCDLYGSTLDILESMHSRIVPGTVIVFDEYLCHPTWRQDEFRAWRECCKRFGWNYEYLAFSLSTKQVVVQVTEG